jgi:hypothetical protein
VWSKDFNERQIQGDRLEILPNYGYKCGNKDGILFGPLLELLESSQNYFNEVCENAKKQAIESVAKEKTQKLAELDKSFA